MLRPPPGLRTAAENDMIESHRESKLTFAAIWDPETGMQSFSGDSLELLQDYQQAELANKVKHEDFIARRNVNKRCRTTSKPVLPKKEPFAILGTRAPHFIGIHTSGVYEKYLKGLVPFKRSSTPTPVPAPVVVQQEKETCDNTDSSFESNEEFTFHVNSVLFSDSDSLLTELDQTEIRYFAKMDSEESPIGDPPEHSVNVPFTPNSVFTFAALWDPKKGLSTLQDGKLVQLPRESGEETDSDDEPPRSHQDCGDSGLDYDGIQEVIYFPRVETSNPSREAIPSSTLDGLRGPWKGEPFYADDEGFYETMPGHLDCDPHLASRFSMTTTSTSRYIRVGDDHLVPSPGPDILTFLGQKPLLSPPSLGFIARHRQAKNVKEDEKVAPPRTSPLGCAARDNSNANSAPSAFNKSTPIPQRLSQVFKTKWAKRARTTDERWVLINIESVITERILEL